MIKPRAVLVALLVTPILLLIAPSVPQGNDRRPQLPDAAEVAGLRLDLLSFSFEVRLVRVHSEAGSAVELVWSLEVRKEAIPRRPQRIRERTAKPRDEVFE